MTVGCIIQARMTSTRLPGKVLKPLGTDNGTILGSVIARASAASGIDETIVACTVNPDDDAIVTAAEDAGAKVFRGSEDDVLSRYYYAAEKFCLDTVVRVTSDCPFIDPDVLMSLIEFYSAGGYDYACNALERTYPHGMDCEIFSFSALETAMRRGETKADREHVTYYMYTHPEEFQIGSLRMDGSENYSDIRITVDTEADYVFACVLSDLLKDRGRFGLRDIIAAVNERPYLKLINSGVRQKKVFESAEDEVAAAVECLNLQDMRTAADMLKNAAIG